MSDGGSSGILTRLTGALPGERRPLVWSFLYFFFVLATYYILRPVRDEMGVRSGVGSLAYLYTYTFIATLVIAPVFAFLVTRMRRRVFVPVVYGFLVLNLLGFWAMLNFGIALDAAARAFFVWITVFAVFAVSVFWSFMADIWSPDQSRRLFTVIAAGGALGGFAGSATVTGLARVVGPANLLLIAAGLLVMAIVAAMSLGRETRVREPDGKKERPKGGVLEGFWAILRSPYMAGIALWVFGLSLAGTFAYNIQADMMGRSGLESAERTQVFGFIDMTANILMPLLQLTLARVALRWLGVGLLLAVLSVVYAAGFIALSLMPLVTVLIVVQIASRATQFAFANPAREALWPVATVDEKYKAKNVVDNAVFRGSDVVNAWGFKSLHEGLGLAIPTIAMIGAPLMAAWFALSLWLGRARERRAPSATEGVPA